MSKLVRSKFLYEGKNLHLLISENISQPWVVFSTPKFAKYNRLGVKYQNICIRAVKFYNRKFYSVFNTKYNFNDHVKHVLIKLDLSSNIPH